MAELIDGPGNRAPSDLPVATVWCLTAASLFILVFAMPRLSPAPPDLSVIVFIRYLGGFLCVLPFAFVMRQRYGRVRSSGLMGHFGRVGSSLGAAFCLYYAVQHVPLADVTAISMSEIGFLLLLAPLLLRERVTRSLCFAAFICVTGAVVVTNPTPSSVMGAWLTPGGWAALASAVFLALEGIAIRYLATRESPIAILIYLNGIAALVVAPIAILLGDFGDPLLYLPILALGPLAILGQYCYIKAYALAEASVLGPIVYGGLPIAGLLGYLLFDEVPGTHFWIGSALIVAGGLWIVWTRR